VEIEGFDELLCRLGAPLRLAEPVTAMDSRYQRRKESFKEQLKKYHAQLTARPILIEAPKTPTSDVLRAIETTVQETKDASDWWVWDLRAKAEPDIAKRDHLYQEGIAACPRSHELHGNYANFLTDIRKDHDRAEALYRKALELDPNHATNTGNYALFLKDIRKDYDRAEALYRKAMELDPNDANHNSNFAEALLEQGKWAASEAQLRRAWQQSWNGDRELLPVTVLLRLCSLWSQTPPNAGQGAAAVRDSLGWLKQLLGEGVRQPTWSFENVFTALAQRWSAERQTFARALASVVNGRADLSSLDAFPEWRDTPALVPPPEW
jgi:tetratricopeptide (TPR) repeat protein